MAFFSAVIAYFRGLALVGRITAGGGGGQCAEEEQHGKNLLATLHK
jgi:hypothetical protein